jgi:hypothetical protein
MCLPRWDSECYAALTLAAWLRSSAALSALAVARARAGGAPRRPRVRADQAAGLQLASALKRRNGSDRQSQSRRLAAQLVAARCKEEQKSVWRFSRSQYFPWNFNLQKYFISSFNDLCTIKETPENGYLDSSGLVWSNFGPN